MKVFVIGSLSCDARIKSVAEYFAELGDKVEYVKKQPDKSFQILVEEALNLISEADRIVAVAKEDGTFGEGTMYELAFAKFLGKDITKFEKMEEMKNEEK